MSGPPPVRQWSVWRRAVRPRRRSVRVRMVAVSVACLLAALAVSLLATSQILNSRLDDRLVREMHQEAEEFAALADGTDPVTGEPFGDDAARIFRVFLQRNVPSRHEVFITYLDGEPYLRSGGEQPARLDRREELTGRWGQVEAMERGHAQVDSVGTISYQALPVLADGQPLGVLVTAWFRDREAAEIGQVLRTATLLGLLVVLAAGVVVWVTTGRVLRPVDNAVVTARTITETDLRQRIDGAGEDEIGRLIATFNDMLDRIQTAFESQRRFIDDAGHELRTPVTIIRGNLDLLHTGDGQQQQASLALVNDELDRMQRMIDDLLTLAKTQQPDFLRPKPLDLDELVEDTLARARGLGDRDWKLDAAAPGVVVADRDRLVQALLQLADNAIQHTAPGDAIAIGAGWNGDDALLWVTDTGPGVSEADSEKIFARFTRSIDGEAGMEPGAVTGGGAGLGLAIVSAIAEAHGGQVVLEHPAGGGARFVLRLPACPPEPQPPDPNGEVS